MCKYVRTQFTSMQWDTSGDPKFTKIAEAYYRSAHGFIVVFSTIDKVCIFVLYCIPVFHTLLTDRTIGNPNMRACVYER